MKKPDIFILLRTGHFHVALTLIIDLKHPSGYDKFLFSIILFNKYHIIVLIDILNTG
jgi:hypothetical protein